MIPHHRDGGGVPRSVLHVRKRNPCRGRTHVAVYVDGPHHDYPDRAARDREQTSRMEDAGYSVLRFGTDQDWKAIIQRYPSIFGALRKEP